MTPPKTFNPDGKNKRTVGKWNKHELHEKDGVYCNAVMGYVRVCNSWDACNRTSCALHSALPKQKKNCIPFASSGTRERAKRYLARKRDDTNETG